MPTWSLEAPNSWAKRGRKMTEVSMAILASRVASPLTPTYERPRIGAFARHSFVTYVLALFLDNSNLCSKHSLSEHFLKKKITAFNEGGWPWSDWGRSWRWSFRLG